MTHVIGDVTKQLNDRMARIYRETGKLPKRLSVSVEHGLQLRAEAAPSICTIDYRNRTVRFCGIPVRVRNYKRERAKKWHGAGAMTLPSGS